MIRSMACREAEPWACPSPDNRCECSRVGPGPQHSPGVIVAACRSGPRSQGHLPIIIGDGLSFIRKRLKGAVKCKSVPYRSGVDQLWPRHAAVFDHCVEQAWTDADVVGGFDARHAAGKKSQLPRGRRQLGAGATTKVVFTIADAVSARHGSVASKASICRGE